MTTSVASPYLARVIAEQDIETLRKLQSHKPDGPRDEAQRDAAIEAILKRLEQGGHDVSREDRSV